MIKTIEDINYKEILNEYLKLENDIVWNDFVKSKQSGLQYIENGDPWLSATGKSNGKDLNFDILNEFFKDTIFEEIIKKYNLKRTRLMWINPGCCYSMHKDLTPRVHIPLITNNQCFMVFKSGIVKYLPPGRVYWTDTRFEHTSMNCSETPRLHLIGVVDK